jgi:hypothetical protein
MEDQEATRIIAPESEPTTDLPDEQWSGDGEDEETIAEGDLPGVYSSPLPEPPESVMQRLREKRKSISERNEIDIDIPGYDGELVARYRLMEGHEFELIGKKVRRQFKSTADRLTYGSADTLIAACVNILIRGADDRLYPLGDLIGLPGEPIRYDDRLAEFLKFEANSARDVILGVFANNELALAQHQVKFARWTSDTSKDVSEDFLGEF